MNPISCLGKVMTWVRNHPIVYAVALSIIFIDLGVIVLGANPITAAGITLVLIGLGIAIGVIMYLAVEY